MIGADNSLVGGLVGATTVLVLNAMVAAAVFASRRVERLVDGDPIVIIRDGEVLRGKLRRELVTEAEVSAAVRHAGIAELADVRLGILEPNGSISVFPSSAPSTMSRVPGIAPPG
jgi:uncharacterized membrane protein YcaP (DUF421 family)